MKQPSDTMPSVQVVVYVRVSTKEQIQNLSLDTQEKSCRDYCERERLAIRRVFAERGESAKTADRPELKRLLTYCREHKGTVKCVVVYRLDRLARNSHDHAVLRARLLSLGVTLKSVSEPIQDDSTGKFVESMFAAIAQLDNDVRADRTKDGMKAAIKAGRWPFQVPVGYRKTQDLSRTSRIEIDPESGPLIRDAFERYASGLHTKRAVLKYVTDRGLRTRAGKPVSPQTFQQMLVNSIYAGWLFVDGWEIDRVRGDFEALVSDEVFDQVQAVLKGKGLSATTHQRCHPDFPLRHFVRCGACMTPLTGSWSKGRSKSYPYYRCRDSRCRAINMRKADLENRFTDYLRRLTPKTEYLSLFREIVLDTWHRKQAEATGTARRLQRRLDDRQRRKDRLVEAFVHERAIDRETYQEQLDKIAEEIALTDMALHDAKLDELDVEAVLGFAEHLMLEAARLWDEISPDQKQRLQSVLFPEGVWYSEEGFGTAATSPIYSLSEPGEASKARMASPAGFEPASPA